MGINQSRDSDNIQVGYPTQQIHQVSSDYLNIQVGYPTQQIHQVSSDYLSVSNLQNISLQKQNIFKTKVKQAFFNLDVKDKILKATQNGDLQAILIHTNEYLNININNTEQLHVRITKEMLKDYFQEYKVYFSSITDATLQWTETKFSNYNDCSENNYGDYRISWRSPKEK
jgi:hypothetical protein